MMHYNLNHQTTNIIPVQALNLRYIQWQKLKTSELHAYKDGAKTCKCLAQEQEQQST